VPRTADRTDPGRLSLGPASKLLGVHPDTLRRWADEGRIETFLSLGGHRRFDRRELERVRSSRQPGSVLPLSSLGATPDRLSRAYRRSYTAEPAETGARSAVPAGDHEAFRTDGRGLSLTESVGLFVAARRPFLSELGVIARRRALDAERISAMFEDASALLDRLLIRLITVHQRAMT
jgi:excisionase family DNA binding protein